jgi:hypothetical protein
VAAAKKVKAQKPKRARRMDKGHTRPQTRSDKINNMLQDVAYMPKPSNMPKDE